MLESKEKKPVVLQVLPKLHQGGVERGTVEIAEALQKKGIKNFVAAEKGLLSHRLQKLKVKHFDLPLNTKNIFKMWLNSYRLAKIIKENGINIVHARSRAPAWSAYWAAKRTGATFMTTFHGTYNMGPLKIKKIYNRVMTYGKVVIAISSHIKNHILKNYKIDPNKIRLIHRCVDVDKFDPGIISKERIISMVKQFNIAEDKPIILSTGRLTHWKGQHLLVEALSRLKNKSFHCIFVGDDQGRTYYTNQLKEAIGKYEMEDKFSFITHVEDVPALMMISSIITSTAIEPEAFGRMTIEGQAMGKITIASNHGGSLENLVDGVTGKLFENNDAESLAEAILWALDLSEKEKKKIGEAAIKHVRENFTKDIMCEKTIKVYEELMR